MNALKQYPDPTQNLLVLAEDSFTGTLVRVNGVHNVELAIKPDEQFQYVEKWAGPHSYRDPESNDLIVEVEHCILSESHYKPLIGKRVCLEVKYTYFKFDLRLEFVSIKAIDSDFSFHIDDIKLEGTLVCINQQKQLIISVDQKTYDQFARWHDKQYVTNNEFCIKVCTGKSADRVEEIYRHEIGNRISILAEPQEFVGARDTLVRYLLWSPPRVHRFRDEFLKITRKFLADVI